MQLHLAGTFVHCHFGCRQTYLPEWRHTSQWRPPFPTIAPTANELSPRQTEVLGNDLGIGQATTGPLDAAIAQTELRDVRLELLGSERQELLAQIPRGSLQGKSHQGGRTTGAGSLIVGTRAGFGLG